jgi:hypothetical protein
LTTLTERAWDPPRYSISDRRKMVNLRG